MIALILGIALLGLIVWLIVTYIPMPDPFRRIIIVVAAIIVILYLAYYFGVLITPPAARVR